ncbi:MULTISPECIES: AraC family transcriptional regulator [Streptomyces]|uniref:Transcriptional regulator n=2 Tax=Streptomyces TaxID=1883 RepID=A0A380PAX7_STRGR|nr:MULTISPECIES: AraC family transcriptional regulator [Streptomyces]NEE37847.1 AraC family transcriptional regulator [Streptomyces sp. SID7982]PJM81524.1 AraC family transcriptional regulator [Streptomyces sp. TSRI0384-2]RPK82782.1 HTH-type transcriptional regulator VirS [Streptomyces sp. ADI98-12]WPR54560.1 AraC family transcriptional regulator ligand-binding domain-containing protein [Streptomyces sp. S399]SUP61987.1 transcriptional regulator [Streptomyces griseus]
MIRGASLRGFARLVEELGGDPVAFTERFAISPDALTSEEGLVPITAHDLMLDAVSVDLRCADFGLRLACGQDLSVLGRLALAIQASSTVAEALECASRFMFVHSPALSVGVEPDPRGRREVVALTYRKDLRESPYSPQAMELGLALFHRVAVALTGGLAGLRSVELPHQPLSPVSRYAEYFGVGVSFGCPAAALRVERRLLDQEFRGADAAIRRLAVDYLTGHHTDPERLVSTHVRRALAASIGATPAVLGQIARLLSMHPRTLQRRLAAESTSLEAIVDDVRRDIALRHITTTDLPLGQIAAMAGFAEQSGLSHAVRRWEGTSPSRLRRRTRGTF